MRLGASTRILAIEDDDDIADFLRAFFRASGYDLVHLNPKAPEDVLTAIDEHQPDVMLLDYGLQGFSGHDVYRLLRAEDAYAFLPVIVVTADMTARSRAATVETGIDGFVTKPFNVKTLAEVVAERIETARAVARVGRDEKYGLFTSRYLRARIADEVAMARDHGALSFALVQIRKLALDQGELSDDARSYVIRKLIAHARARLPAGTLLGRTDTEELAILVSGVAPGELAPVLEEALDEARSRVTLPSGVGVRVELAAGLAGYPEHAGDPDELYMAADAALADAVDAGARLRVAI